MSWGIFISPPTQSPRRLRGRPSTYPLGQVRSIVPRRPPRVCTISLPLTISEQQSDNHPDNQEERTQVVRSQHHGQRRGVSCPWCLPVLTVVRPCWWLRSLPPSP